MNLMKCNNGHFFDGDKYSSCPHCSGGGAAADSAFGNPAPGQTVGYSNNDMATVPGVGIAPDPYPPVGSGFMTQPTEPGVIPGGTNNNDTLTGVKTDLEDDLVTQGARSLFNPVVGWLVVKNGEEKGRSKTLTGGKNFIGRDSSMDVVLSGDKSISRIRHAIVTYEPNSRQFFAMPGESHELFYVNKEVVLNNIVLNPYDVITVGKTELVFVPFCGENFIWDEAE